MDDSTLTPQFDIDLAAQRHLSEAMEANWLLRKRTPDIFIDYEIEQRTAGEPTGRTGYVQLKGQAEFNGNNEFAKVEMKTKHLRHYLDAVRTPVFVVVVDISKKQAWYLFAQPWVLQNESAVRSQEKITVCLPIDNKLENFPKLAADFQNALRWMNDRYPGRPEAAVAMIERQYESLDDRFAVKMSATSSGRHFTVSAKVPAQVAIDFKGIPLAKIPEIQNALDWGKSFQLSDVTMTAKGSKLFETVFSSARGGFAFKAGKEGTCVAVIAAKSRGKTTRISLPAILSTGPKGTLIETSEQSAPLFARIKIFTPVAGKVPEVQFEIQICLQNWVGQKIRKLPWLKEATSFVRAVANNAVVSIEIPTALGNVEATIAKGDRFKGVKECAPWFTLLSDAAKIAEHYDMDVTIPSLEGITEEDIATMSASYDALCSGTVSRTWINILQQEAGESVDLMMRELKEKGELFGIFKACVPHVVNVLGVEKIVGVSEIEPMPCRLVPLERALPGFKYGFRLERNPVGNVTLHVRDQPTLGIECGGFIFDDGK